MACARRETGAGGGTVGGDTSTAQRTAAQARAHYARGDAEATGAWTWTSPAGRVFALVDVQSTIAGIIQARADLWVNGDSDAIQIGRSDAMPSAAELGAYAFEDLTGDSLPDLFGYVADSAGVSYPVFIPGAIGAMGDLIEQAAPSWRFSTDEEQAPSVMRAGSTACALQLWALDPAPDNKPAGWRWLALVRGGRLAPPAGVQPSCVSAPQALQPTPARP